MIPAISYSIYPAGQVDEEIYIPSVNAVVNSKEILFCQKERITLGSELSKREISVPKDSVEKIAMIVKHQLELDKLKEKILEEAKTLFPPLPVQAQTNPDAIYQHKFYCMHPNGALTDKPYRGCQEYQYHINPRELKEYFGISTKGGRFGGYVVIARQPIQEEFLKTVIQKVKQDQEGNQLAYSWLREQGIRYSEKWWGGA